MNDKVRGQALTSYKIKKLYEKQQSEQKEAYHREVRRMSIERKLSVEKLQLDRKEMAEMDDADATAPVQVSCRNINTPNNKSLNVITEEALPLNIDGGGSANNITSASEQTGELPEIQAQPRDPPTRRVLGFGALSKFKDAAKTVTIHNNLYKEEGGDKLTNLASAMILAVHKSKEAQGTTTAIAPACNLFSKSHLYKDAEHGHMSSIESNKLKLRPLEMPQSVKEQRQEKWTEVMASVQSAVQWKIRALREDTGTLSKKQMLRQQHEERADRQTHHAAVFPGEARTAWAMKNYVKNGVKDLVASQRPENKKRSSNQKLIARASFPVIIDRVRSTSSIMRQFRDLKGQLPKTLEDEK